MSIFWKCSRLTFFKEQIESLQMHESFTVSCPEGDFTMTKAEFYEEFENVILSASYQKKGVYDYTMIPGKAWKFVQKKAA